MIGRMSFVYLLYMYIFCNKTGFPFSGVSQNTLISPIYSVLRWVSLYQNNSKT